MTTKIRRCAALGSCCCLLAAGALADSRRTIDEQAGAGEQDLDEIVVTSSKIEVPRRQLGVAVSVVAGEEIALRGYATLADVLRTQPGVAVSNNGGPGQSTAVRVRGEEGFRTLALIDGVKISDPTTPQVSPRFDHLLTTSDLERVEILRGPQGFIYGADAGGVINILSRTGEGRPSGAVGIEYGSFGSRSLDGAFSGGGERGDFYVSVADVAVDGFNVRSTDTVLADDDGYDNTTLHTKLGWRLSDELRLQLVARDVDARTEYDGCGFPSTAVCVGESQQTTLRVSASHATERFSNDLALSNLSVESQDFADGAPAFATDGDLARAEYTGSFRPNATTALVYGLDLQREEIESSGDRLSRDQFAYYFEYQATLGERLFVTAGARHDDNDDFGSHTSARLAAAYVQQLENGATLKYRGSIGSGFRPPSLFEIAYNAGPFAFPPASAIDLVEESTQGFDVGIEFRTARGGRAELSWFDQRIDDQIFFDLTAFSGYLQERGRSESRGIELDFEAPLAETWAVFGNVTWNRTEDASGRQRIRRPELLANLGVRASSADERLRLLANYRLARDAVDEVFPVGRVPLDDYGVIDVSTAFAVNDSLEVFARIENLLDEDYAEVAGFNSPARAGYAGVRLRF